MARWSRRGRAVQLALAVVALLALVSVGSLREEPRAGGGTPRFPSALVETLLLLAAVALLAVSVLVARALLPGGNGAARRPRNPLVGPLVVLLSALVFGLLGRLGWLEALRSLYLGSPAVPQDGGPTPSTALRPLPRGGPRWLSFVVVGVLLLGPAVAAVVQWRRERRRHTTPADPHGLADLLGHTLADLEHEADARRAVIAAWVRMERGLAAAGLPRLAAETPLEYAARVLERAKVTPASVRRLADLYEQAKFSQHTVDEEMRRAAVEAVTVIREELEAEQATIEAVAGSREVAG